MSAGPGGGLRARPGVKHIQWHELRLHAPDSLGNVCGCISPS